MYTGFVCLCGVALSYKFKGLFLLRFHFCTWHEINVAGVMPVLHLISAIQISYRCVEGVFPAMKSVAVISSVYKVKQYTDVKTGTGTGQGFSTLYIHHGDLCYNVMAVQVNLNAGCL